MFSIILIQNLKYPPPKKKKIKSKFKMKKNYRSSMRSISSGCANGDSYRRKKARQKCKCRKQAEPRKHVSLGAKKILLKRNRCSATKLQIDRVRCGS